MIHTRNLTREFHTKGETVQAVKGLDIDVEAGELVSFLGPNGAGKSTSLRMLTTLLLPTSGSATVAGRDVVADPNGVRAAIGYVGQGNGAGGDQRVRDELVNQGRFCGLTKAEARTRAGELLEMLELDATADRQADRLSGGQRRRLDIAMGLIHRPGLLFLDEPSTGLDPHSRANLWEHILRLRADQGTTVFMTTHYLDEADAMAERVMVIDDGRIIADGTADDLKGKVSGDLVAFGVAEPGEAERAAAAARPLADAGGVQTDGTELRMRVSRGEEALPGLLRALDEAGVRLTTVRVQRPTLDDVFLTLTGRSLREGEGEPRSACPRRAAGRRRPAASGRSEPRSRPARNRPLPAPAPPAGPRPTAGRPHPRHPPVRKEFSMKVLRDTGIMFQRQMAPTLRNPLFFLVFGMMQPVLYLVLFGPLLSGMPGPLGADPMQWFVPGMLCMLAVFATAFAGFGLLPEMQAGVHERLLAAPVSRVALLLGRVLRDVLVLIAQALVVIAGAAAFGVQVSIPGALAGLLLLAVLGVGLGTLSYLLAMALKVPFKFSGALQAVIMPLILLSGVMLPMDLAPGWLYALSRINPVSHVVDAERALFNGGFAVSEIGLGAGVAVAVAALALALGARSMRRLNA